MKSYKDMTRLERSIAESVRAGWDLSGEYVAISADCGERPVRKTFESDSIGALVLDIYRWYKRDLYAGRSLPDASRLLVKQSKAL